jgi:hypothetical protein
VLGGASLKPELNAGFNAVSFHEEDGSILLAPRSNTWSRSARRQAARATTSFDASEQTKGTLNGDQEHTEPLMRVRLSFLAPTPPTSATDGEWRGATLTLHFLEGRDRSVVEAFWKFLLAKAGLVGRNEESAAAGRGGLAGRGRRGGSH